MTRSATDAPDGRLCPDGMQWVYRLVEVSEEGLSFINSKTPNGVGVSYSGGYINKYKAQIDKAAAAIKSGKIKVPTKPFSLEELVARLRALLRRTGATEVIADEEKIRFADLELDEATHEVRRAANLIDLSPTEFLLLRYLMINADRVVSKSQILDHVWQYDFRGDMGIVETYVSYLRKKIDVYEPALIHTVRGVGYRLRLPATK